VPELLGLVYRVIAAHLIKQAGYTQQCARTGAVTLIQRFGSARLQIPLEIRIWGAYTFYPPPGRRRGSFCAKKFMNDNFLRACELARQPEIHAMRLLIFKLLSIGLCALCATSSWAIDWPQVISSEEGEVIVYQPQPESLDGQLLAARAAFQINLHSAKEPTFGAMWFTARLATDRDADRATIRDVTIEQVTWPDSKDADEQRLIAVLEGSVPDAGFDISMSALAASLATAETVQQSLENLNNDPPKIVFAQSLAVLALFDGEPKLADIEGSDYQRVLNVPMAIACKQRGKQCWLSSGKFWYAADDPLGPWTPTKSPPRDLASNMPPMENPEDQPDNPPAIVVATEPTELIVSAGAPEWTALKGGELLYVSNTESPWLRDLPTGNMYVLLSGRWYRAESETGPWTFVPATELPASFAAIPPASDIGGLRTSVAGTPEAEDAVRDQAIPQTAAIDRKTTTLTVEYDGKPKFEEIKGTDVAYAVNTGAQVLKVGDRFYAVDNGVWFTSANAQGPWSVADEVPSNKIAEIPPSSPVYNTTHVHVYESTPDVVYVGYTPGYLWSYAHYGVPVYGTGWYYRPYYGRWYYPRPPTWGFNVGYNPWTGWNFGLSWSSGFFNFGMSWGGGYGGAYRPWGCCGGWYGGGYRGPTFVNNGTINIGNNVSVGNRRDVVNRVGKDNRMARMDRSKNLYNRPENLARKADRSAVRRDLSKARPATGKMNNIYADKSGQVVRPNGDKWQTRENGQWQDAADRVGVAANRPAARPAERPQQPVARPAPRPESRPIARPAPRPALRPVTRPARRPSPAIRPMSRPMTRPATGSLHPRDLNRAAMARQRGHLSNRSRLAPMARPMPRRR
jgi:hypothetical protein